MHFGADVGFGVQARNYSTPVNIRPYSGSPVGAISLGAHVQPIAKLSASIALDRTLVMNTPIGSANASTSITRWEVAASYAVISGSVEVAPRVGIGRRWFSVDSTSTERSPDSDYMYLIAGVAASAKLSDRIALVGAAAFE